MAYDPPLTRFELERIEVVLPLLPAKEGKMVKRLIKQFRRKDSLILHMAERVLRQAELLEKAEEK